MANPIYSAQRPNQTLTFPVCQAFEVKRDFDTITDLQTLNCCPFTLDLGQPGDLTTLVVKFEKNGKQYTLRAGNVLVLLPTGDYEQYATVTDFLAVYHIV
jgi:hypothetical protein